MSCIFSPNHFDAFESDYLNNQMPALRGLELMQQWIIPFLVIGMPVQADVTQLSGGLDSQAFLNDSLLGIGEKGVQLRSAFTKRYALQHRLPYTVLYDEGAKVASQHGLQTAPKIFFVQQNGNIVHTSIKVNKQAIEALLGEQR